MNLSVNQLRPCPPVFFANAFLAVNRQATFIQSLRDEPRASVYIFNSTSPRLEKIEHEDELEHEDD